VQETDRYFCTQDLENFLQEQKHKGSTNLRQSIKYLKIHFDPPVPEKEIEEEEEEDQFRYSKGTTHEVIS